MVRKKETKSKAEIHREHMENRRQRLDEQTIKFQWAVIEVLPDKHGDGFNDPLYTPGWTRVVSEWFDTQSDAMKWLNEHEADPPKYLKVVRSRIIEKVVQERIMG
jgi:hypothetical protein